MTERNAPLGSAEELARSLIASARLDVEPAPDVVRYGILAAISSAGALGSTSAVAGVTLDALRRLGLAKWIATTAILGSVGAGAYAVMTRTPISTANAGRAREPEPAVAHGNEAPIALPPTAEMSAAPGVPAGDAPENGANLPAASGQRHRAAAAKGASLDKVNASDASSLEGEVAALDGARTVLAGGDPRRTLGLLDQYQQASREVPFDPRPPTFGFRRSRSPGKPAPHGI